MQRNNRLRIIAGRWRGRQLVFPQVQGLRPTPDRVRETLFNWLAPLIADARCLDLCAGSGALGIEALSRGAGQTVFVERHPQAARALRENLAVLGVADVQVVQADALAWLTTGGQPFDVVFLDPPYGQGLLPVLCAALADNGWVAPATRVYLEAERELQTLIVPAAWQTVRQKVAGQVGYRLLVVGRSDFQRKIADNS